MSASGSIVPASRELGVSQIVWSPIAQGVRDAPRDALDLSGGTVGLDATDVTEQIANLRASTMTDVVRTYVPAESVEEQWDLPTLEKVLREEWQLEVPVKAEVAKSDAITDEEIVAGLPGYRPTTRPHGKQVRVRIRRAPARRHHRARVRAAVWRRRHRQC